jgi:hypothetical protein
MWPLKANFEFFKRHRGAGKCTQIKNVIDKT